MSKNKTKTIVTVGDGVAAWCVHYYLRNTGVKLINISSESFINSCSATSTAINCLRGTTPGNSPLGDTIIEAMDEFLKFNREEKPQGVHKGFEYQILENDTISKWERRYPEFHDIQSNEFLSSLVKGKNLYHKVPAHFINVEEFANWMKSRSDNIEYIQDFVTSVTKDGEEYRVQTQSQSVHGDAVILCTGAATHLLSKEVTSEFRYYLDHSKPVTGGYLEMKKASDKGFAWDHNFVLAIEKYHFIYRMNEDVIQIGSSSKNNDALELPLKDMLKSIYDHIDRYTTFDIPKFSEFEVITGVRHKGHLRRPFWGKIDDNQLYAVCGLYKNAYSFGFKAAEDILKALK